MEQYRATLIVGLRDYSLSMKTLQKKGTQEETSRPKLSRGSTILDYINVVPKTRFLVSGQLYFQTNIPCSLCSSSFPNPPTPMLQRYKGETSIQDETQTPAPSQSSRLPCPAPPPINLVCSPGSCGGVGLRGQGGLAAYLHELPTHLSLVLRAVPQLYPCLA